MTKSPRRLKERVQETVGEQVRDLPLHAVRLAMFGVGRALLLSDRMTRDYKEMRENGVAPVLGRLRDDAQHTAVKVAGQVVTLVRRPEDEHSPRPPTPVATPPRPKPRPVAEDVAVSKPAGEPVARPAAEPGNTPAPKPSPPPSPKPATQAEVARPEPKPESKPEPKPEAPKPEQPNPTAKTEAAGPQPQPEPETPKAEQLKPVRPEPKAADLPVPDYDTATMPQLRARLRGLTADQVRLLREYERKHAARADVLKMFENRISKLNGGR